MTPMRRRLSGQRVLGEIEVNLRNYGKCDVRVLGWTTKGTDHRWMSVVLRQRSSRIVYEILTMPMSDTAQVVAAIGTIALRIAGAGPLATIIGNLGIMMTDRKTT